MHESFKYSCSYSSFVNLEVPCFLFVFYVVRFEKQAPSKAKLREEIETLKSVLLNHNCPVVFCHNDLLCKNIVYDKNKGEPNSASAENYRS